MRVLVVEDDRRIADSIAKGLIQEGYAVDRAFDGEGGYDLASNEHYDVVILDIMLPKMDGVEMCRLLREEGNNCAIIMLTARGEVQDRIFGLNAGADDYLAKPFSFEELLARVRALARRPKSILSTKLKIGELELDYETGEARKNGKRVGLSKREFALLEYMMRNKGKTLSKEKIMQNLWSFESDILPNTVEVYIGYLRAKVGKEIIETVRGFGYRLKNV